MKAMAIMAVLAGGALAMAEEGAHAAGEARVAVLPVISRHTEFGAAVVWGVVILFVLAAGIGPVYRIVHPASPEPTPDPDASHGHGAGHN